MGRSFKKLSDDFTEGLDLPQETLTQLQHIMAKAMQYGYIEGMHAFAWMKDGTTYVGTCGTTLADAVKKVTDTQATLM